MCLPNKPQDAIFAHISAPSSSVLSEFTFGDNQCALSFLFGFGLTLIFLDPLILTFFFSLHQHMYRNGESDCSIRSEARQEKSDCSMSHCDDITVHSGCASERHCLHSDLMSTLTDALTSSCQDSSQTPQRIVHPCIYIVDQIVIESTERDTYNSCTTLDLDLWRKLQRELTRPPCHPNVEPHTVDVHENLTMSKLDDHVKINVALRDAPGELPTVREQR